MCRFEIHFCWRIAEAEAALGEFEFEIVKKEEEEEEESGGFAEEAGKPEIIDGG